MEEKKTNSRSRLEEVQADVCKLLYTDVSSRGWETRLAQEKCFRIMGFDWFRDDVMSYSGKGIAIADGFVERMKEIIDSRKSWHVRGFDWKEQYSARKFGDAYSPHIFATLSFVKAAQGIVLCEAILEYLHAKHPALVPPPHMVYEKMRIVAAASYINKLTTDFLEERCADETFLHRLCQFTDQTDSAVFWDMAKVDRAQQLKGHTVSQRLAERTYRFMLDNKVRTYEIDPPQFYYAPHRHAFVPSRHEDFDESVLSDPDIETPAPPDTARELSERNSSGAARQTSP